MFIMRNDHKEYYPCWIFTVVVALEILFVASLIWGFAIFVAPFMA